MSSWSKFHERHGNVTSKRPQHVYGSYISDPRQYERSSAQKGSMLTKVVSCLGCLVGKGSLSKRPGSRRKGKTDTRYMYNENSYEYGRSSAMHNFDPAMKTGRTTRRGKGNITYLQ